MSLQQYLMATFYYKDGNLLWRHSQKGKGNYRNKADSVFGFVDSRGYMRGRIDGKKYLLHRLIWIYHNGDIEDGMIIDHMNRDILNNNIENLRALSVADNARNSSARGYSRSENGEKWKVRVRTNGEMVFYGRFDTEEEALSARENAKSMHHKTYYQVIDTNVS